MKNPQTARAAVLAAGVVISMLACLAVGTLLERSLSSQVDAAPIEAARAPGHQDGAATPPEILHVGQPRP